MKYDTMLIYKSQDTTFYMDMIHKTWYKNKVHKSPTMMGLEKPWDDPLVILEVVSIQRLQVLAIHRQV